MSDKMIALADMAGMDRDAVAKELCQMFEKSDALDGAEVVVAYVSVGDYGCDSSALIVFEREGKLYEVNGSHCSCYGFEGQWEPEDVKGIEAICQRSDWSLASGGYDDDHASNAEAIRTHLRNLYGDAA